jgi:uncharacterized protein (DUF952 family)
MRETYHLVPLEIWSAGDPTAPYVASSLGTEGFAHCTDGLGALGETFERHYRADARPFLALIIDLDALDVPWRYDAPGSPYPHVYGAIARRAILAVERVERDEGGGFVGLATR